MTGVSCLGGALRTALLVCNFHKTLKFQKGKVWPGFAVFVSGDRADNDIDKNNEGRVSGLGELYNMLLGRCWWQALLGGEVTHRCMIWWTSKSITGDASISFCCDAQSVGHHAM